MRSACRHGPALGPAVPSRSSPDSDAGGNRARQRSSGPPPREAEATLVCRLLRHSRAGFCRPAIHSTGILSRTGEHCPRKLSGGIVETIFPAYHRRRPSRRAAHVPLPIRCPASTHRRDITMNYRLAWPSLVVLAAVANNAAAVNCVASPGYTRVAGGTTLRDFLGGKFVCATRGADVWRECHGTISGTSPTTATCAASGNGGALSDLKQGPGDSVDPSEQVGTWSATNEAGAQVTYRYGTGGSGGVYTYQVWTNGTTYDFCGSSPAGNNVLGATIRDSNSPCP
jgi:hypothetical protein